MNLRWKTIAIGNNLAVVMLTYRTVEKLSFMDELGHLVGFFKKSGFKEEMFSKSEVHGPRRKYGRNLGSYLWQGYFDPNSPFYQDKLR